MFTHTHTQPPVVGGVPHVRKVAVALHHQDRRGHHLATPPPHHTILHHTCISRPSTHLVARLLSLVPRTPPPRETSMTALLSGTHLWHCSAGPIYGLSDACQPRAIYVRLSLG